MTLQRTRSDRVAARDMPEQEVYSRTPKEEHQAQSKSTGEEREEDWSSRMMARLAARLLYPVVVSLIKPVQVGAGSAVYMEPSAGRLSGARRRAVPGVFQPCPNSSWYPGSAGLLYAVVGLLLRRWSMGETTPIGFVVRNLSSSAPHLRTAQYPGRGFPYAILLVLRRCRDGRSVRLLAGEHLNLMISTTPLTSAEFLQSTYSRSRKRQSSSNSLMNVLHTTL
nr:hypothetical protein CFP56_36475 [Quercus suber]